MKLVGIKGSIVFGLFSLDDEVFPKLGYKKPKLKERRVKPLSVLITTDNSLLSAGKLHIIKCATSGSVPPARITWVLDGEPIRNAATTMLEDILHWTRVRKLIKIPETRFVPGVKGLASGDGGSELVEGHNSTTSTLTFRPTASDDIKELACRAENPHFPGGLQEDRRRLRIAYPPVVSVRVEERSQLGPLKEGDEVRMSCEVRASPPADGITWYHGVSRYIIIV
uniref:Ig-like domain-containing protein n=1 Tax=Timema poppense TaxID=170557 RepID=A0A7R9GRQ1_TIMPO|nr:unnamed protein product [Timema poppensis]